MFAKIAQEKNSENPQLNLTNDNNKSKEDNNNEDIHNNQDEINKLIKDMPLNNLNDYYDLETNLFKKRIEKLNLKFYWIYESILGEETINNLLYPYNKLFLILFKEISLYIEEILRLNKQLNLKSKNEKYYIQKINDYKIKEKDYLLTKQKIKIVEKNLKISEKNNDKLKNEIEKLNKKNIFTNNSSIFNSNSNFIEWKKNLYSNNRKFNNLNKTSSKFYPGNITEQGSIMSSGSNNLTNRNYINKKNKSKELTTKINNNRINSNSSLYTKTTNISLGGNNKDFIYIGINQCEDEINNLNLIENLLMEYYNKKSLSKRKMKSYKKLSPERFNNNETNFTSFKKKLNVKKIKKGNKSLDYKTNIINTANKI